MRISLSAASLLALPLLGAACTPGVVQRVASNPTVVVATSNDNRRPAGRLNGGVLRLDLDAVWAGWRPDLDVDSAVTVQAFAERGKKPVIPGPLLRVTQGTEVRVSVRNLISDSTLIVHGLRGGTVADDTVSVAPGAMREIAFTARSAGTFLYWGTTSHSPLDRRIGRDAQLTGVIVVDPPGSVTARREDRIFVITLIALIPDTTKQPPRENVVELAVNGRSWPHTERLGYSVSDTARWRWINGSNRLHPIHLHGFHFRVLSKGSGSTDTAYAPEATRLAVTELMLPGSTMSLEWILTRPGNWLVHCHMIPHISPFPRRPDRVREHDVHDLSRHPFQSMAGLVVGVTVTDRRGSYVTPTGPPSVSHRLFLQQASAEPGKRPRKGFVLQRGAEPRPDSVEVPGTALIVNRDQRTSVTIVNRLTSPTSVHWHGMELESVFDGVAGYSGVGAQRAPLIVPGDSFTVWFTPPRAGTYMYHSHMDEEDQMASGMYAPLLVLEPGEMHDPASDLTFMIGEIPGDRDGHVFALNGSPSPGTMTLRAGKLYRLRLLNLARAAPASIELAASDSTVERWRLVSKDGATTPRALMGEKPARVRMGVGEAYDFEWSPAPGEMTLSVQHPAAPGIPLRPPLRQRFIVKP